MSIPLKNTFKGVGLVLLLLIMLTACTLDDVTSKSLHTDPPKGAWIDAPLSGAEAPPGFSVNVIGHVDPSVGQALLYVNGVNSGLPSAPIPGKQPPAYQWQWSAEQPGIYYLSVGGEAGPLSSPVMVTISGELTYRAEFWADQESMKLGECTAMHWKTENAVLVQLDGVQVDLEGDQGVCPQADEEHVLHVEYKDKDSEDLTLKLFLIVDSPTPTFTDTPTPTLTPTRVPPTTAPPPLIATTPPIIFVPISTTAAPPQRDSQPPSAPRASSPCGSQTAPTYACGVVTLSWSAVKDQSGIKQYEISITNTDTFAVQKYTTASTSFTLKNVTEGYYKWVVRAQDNAGNWGPTSNACYYYCYIVR